MTYAWPGSSLDDSDSCFLLSGLLIKLATDFELKREEEGRRGSVSVKEYGENDKSLNKNKGTGVGLPVSAVG